MSKVKGKKQSEGRHFFEKIFNKDPKIHCLALKCTLGLQIVHRGLQIWETGGGTRPPGSASHFYFK